MLLLFELITITVIWCMGIKILTAEGMILQKLGRWAENKVNEGYLIWEPLVVCEYCLPSIHTAIAIVFALGMGVINSFTWNLLFYYPIVAMASSLLNGLIWQFYKLQNTKKELYESLTETSEIIKEYYFDRIEAEDEEIMDQQFFDYEKFNN